MTPAEQMRVQYWLGVAEDDLESEAGVAFHLSAGRDVTTKVPTTKSARDWVQAVCIVAEWYWLNEDPEDRKANALPYQSQRLGDYSYDMGSRRNDVWRNNQQLRRILRRNRSADSYQTGTHFTVAPSGYQLTLETSERG